MNKLSKTICLISALSVLTACSGDRQSAPNKAEANKSLNAQLEDIKRPNALDISNVAGETDTEKLMYLLDLPTATKSAMLIFLDAQVDSLEAVGNHEAADAMRQNRALLTQAVDENMPFFVTESAKIYEGVFSKEEILQLIELHSQPVMKKFTGSSVTLQQKALPVAEKWSAEHVTPRYLELLKEQGGN